MSGGPARRFTLGDATVDLWRGFLWDEVRVWQDVSPAAGGLVGARRLWRGRTGDAKADALFDECVAGVVRYHRRRLA